MFYSNSIKNHQGSFLHIFVLHLISIYGCPAPFFLAGQAWVHSFCLSKNVFKVAHKTDKIEGIVA